MARLRAPGGCPWDREQTFDTIKKYTLEETYEVLEAIDNRDWQELTSELGDLLLQVLFYSEMAKEIGFFNIDDVLDSLSKKLIGRHPHVFGDVRAEDAQTVLQNWETIKKEEERLRAATNGKAAETSAGLLEAVSSKMPALMEAEKISSKAAHVGFDWPDINGLFEKLTEETKELQEQLEQVTSVSLQPRAETKINAELHARIEDEIGDLFFVMVNLARRLSVDPESALRRTNRKFRRRFGFLEQKLKDRGTSLEDAPLELMESLWQQAKLSEEDRR